MEVVIKPTAANPENNNVCVRLLAGILPIVHPPGFRDAHVAVEQIYQQLELAVRSFTQIAVTDSIPVELDVTEAVLFFPVEWCCVCMIDRSPSHPYPIQAEMWLLVGAAAAQLRNSCAVRSMYRDWFTLHPPG